MRDLKPSRILWLSDIHFREEYTDEKGGDFGVGRYLESFLEEVGRENDTTPIGTVIITGDLAHSGKTKEYDSLKVNIIDRLKSLLGTQMKLFTIPGNHDVLRESVDGLFNELKSNGTDLSTTFRNFELKQALLTSHRDHYLSLFTDYSKFARIVNSNADIQGYTNVEDNHRLFGYCVDSDNKIIYFLLNTAWFCMSQPLEEMNFQNFKNGLSGEATPKEILDAIDKLLKVNKFTNENGGQIIGQKLMSDSTASILFDDKYHTYTKITLMHHPFHWLRWEEMYSYAQINNSLLNNLIRHSDLVLTGHEHVPDYIEPGLISDRTWHIPGGMFLDHNVKKLATNNGSAFPHNRFSILNIYPEKATESRFLFRDEAILWEKRQFPIVMPFKRVYRDITDEKLITKFVSHLNKNVRIYFEQHWGITLSEIKSFGDSDTVSTIKAFSDGNNVWLVICPRQYHYYKNALSDSTHKAFIANMVNKIMDLKPLAVISVAFFSLDLSINNEVYAGRLSETSGHEIAREERFGQIVQEADLLFDRFRHLFFNERLDSPDFAKLTGIRFVNIPIPYWRADHFTEN